MLQKIMKRKNNNKNGETLQEYCCKAKIGSAKTSLLDLDLTLLITRVKVKHVKKIARICKSPAVRPRPKLVNH